MFSAFSAFSSLSCRLRSPLLLRRRTWTTFSGLQWRWRASRSAYQRRPSQEQRLASNALPRSERVPCDGAGEDARSSAFVAFAAAEAALPFAACLAPGGPGTCADGRSVSSNVVVVRGGRRAQRGREGHVF